MNTAEPRERVAPRKRYSNRASRRVHLSLPVGEDGNETETLAVPGRPKRKRQKASFWKRLRARWYPESLLQSTSLVVAILLWYSLGIVSISTSKILLNQKVSPIFLTFQQLLIGSLLLRILLEVRFLNSPGLKPLSSHRQLHTVVDWLDFPLFRCAAAFSLGFWATNCAFSVTTSPSFVETIKAAEPLTSAVVAVGGGLETLSSNEGHSLIVLVVGVLLATANMKGAVENDPTGKSFWWDSFVAFFIVMTSNLCFSLKGYFQKIFSHESTLDDLNLQFRLLQTGTVLMTLPALFSFSFSLPSFSYILLAIVNACAFCAYNLASTVVLSKLRVIHHAALNGLRRVVAVLVTSVLFGVPLTLGMAMGIAMSVVGFLSFTHHQAQRKQKPKNVSALLPQRRRSSSALIPNGGAD